MGSRARRSQLPEDIEVLVTGGPDAPVVTIAPEPSRPAVPDGVTELIVAVADAVVPAAARTRPDKIGVEFGIAVSGKTGRPSLTTDPGKAAFRVFMEWAAPAREDQG